MASMNFAALRRNVGMTGGASARYAWRSASHVPSGACSGVSTGRGLASWMTSMVVSVRVSPGTRVLGVLGLSSTTGTDVPAASVVAGARVSVMLVSPAVLWTVWGHGAADGS